MDRVAYFKEHVERIMPRFLTANNFELEDFIVKGTYYTCFLYKSPEGRLKIYDDVMNGDVNCELQRMRSDGSYGPWEYYMGLSRINKNKTIDELLLQVPKEVISIEDRLIDVRDILEKYIDVMWAELRALD